jgi:hypothetical protein
MNWGTDQQKLDIKERESQWRQKVHNDFIVDRKSAKAAADLKAQTASREPKP